MSGYVYAGVTRWGGGGSQSAKAGTLGGVFRMPVDGGAWTHMMTGFPEVIHVHCLTIHPNDSSIVFAGTHDGVYRSTDHGCSWHRMQLMPRECQIWSVAVSPHDENLLFAGASPTGIYVSRDGGESWTHVQAGVVPDRLPMGTFKNRVMRIAFNPADPRKLCAAMEVNGVMSSEDSGKTWVDRSDELVRLSEQPRLKSQILTTFDSEGMLDAHAIFVTHDGASSYLANRMGLFRSPDNGVTWEDVGVGRYSEFTYGRDIRPSMCEPGVVFACLSESSQGRTGSVAKSVDGGKAWKRYDHGVLANSTVMAVSPHARQPGTVYFAARKGEVFGTCDDGRTWNVYPLPAGCEGVYCIACA